MAGVACARAANSPAMISASTIEKDTARRVPSTQPIAKAIHWDRLGRPPFLAVAVSISACRNQAWKPNSYRERVNGLGGVAATEDCSADRGGLPGRRTRRARLRDPPVQAHRTADH